MKRHIIGFLLFGFILTTSIVTYQSWIMLQMQPIEFMAEDYFQKNKPFEKSNVKIIQAVFNQPTKQLNVSFLYKRDELKQKANIKLHFFVKNWKGLYYITSERAETTFAMNMRRSRVLNAYIRCEWLAEIKPKENLYVLIEELPNNITTIETTALNFDSSLAVPLLIDYSMDDYIEEHSPKGC